MAQTTIQNPKSLMAGSGVLYIGEDFSSLVNIGAIRDLNFVHKTETSELTFDNVETIKKNKYFNKFSFDFKLTEINPDIYKLFNKGLVNVSFVNGTTQSITDEEIVLNTGKVKLLANKNGDGTRVANIVVKSSDGATTYTEGTDYEVVVDANGYTGLVLIDGGGITSGDTVKVSYDYTPATAKEITYAQSGLASPVVVRFIHKDVNGKTLTIDLENVVNIKTLGVDFVGDNEDDIATMDIELEGYVKKITDEITV